MSLATFKKKSIYKSSTASKISGIPTNQYWIYQGPYGLKNSLSSTIFLKSILGADGKTGDEYSAHNAGFSINGVYRNVGPIGQTMAVSQSFTPYRGVHPKGWGGTKGRYPQGPDNTVLNINPVTSKVATAVSWVKPSVLSTKGMLERRFRWINNGQYPNYWVQPVYTGNQTDSASQGLYVQNKSAANDCWYDVNNSEVYVDYVKNCGATGCRTTPANGYTMAIQQANAPYTKTLHQPKDASDYTLRVQRKCQDPVGLQKPFPYAVQTGTGVLTGGITVSNVASSCNTSNIQLTPPAWYTGVKLKENGTLTTLEDQLRSLRDAVKKIKSPHQLQNQVFNEVILNGTTA
jgi:hypothetical protein